MEKKNFVKMAGFAVVREGRRKEKTSSVALQPVLGPGRVGAAAVALLGREMEEGISHAENMRLVRQGGLRRSPLLGGCWCIRLASNDSAMGVQQAGSIVVDVASAFAEVGRQRQYTF